MEQATDKRHARKPSKWRNFLEEAERVNLSDDALEHIRACSKEFRDSFHFKHDPIEEESDPRPKS